jgi:hypothetical protein
LIICFSTVFSCKAWTEDAAGAAEEGVGVATAAANPEAAGATAQTNIHPGLEIGSARNATGTTLHPEKPVSGAIRTAPARTDSRTIRRESRVNVNNSLTTLLIFIAFILIIKYVP